MLAVVAVLQLSDDRHHIVFNRWRPPSDSMLGAVPKSPYFGISGEDCGDRVRSD